MTSFFFVILYLFSFIPTIKCGIKYVDPSATGTGLGRTWSNAFTTLEAAIAEANDQIWLKGGNTYIPSTSDRFDCFQIPQGIRIYGGFIGNETDIGSRPSPGTIGETIISGNIGDQNTIIDNCYHVLTYDQTLTLDGVVISDGYANYEYYENNNNVLDKYGAAIIKSGSYNTNLHFNNVIFRNNIAINGGALWFSSTATSNVDVIITNCKFENNKAIDGLYGGGYGGAIYLYQLANVSIYNSEFINNEADFRGGAIYQDYGGFLYCDHCTFTNNNAGAYGGAIFSDDRNSQTDGTFPYISDSLFVGNTADLYGGAICWYNFVQGTLIDNTFTSNTATLGGAIALIKLSVLLIDDGNIDSGNNDATQDAGTNYKYINLDDDTYTGPDSWPTFNLQTELNAIHQLFEAIYPETDDLYTNLDDPICFVAGDVTGGAEDGSSWTDAYNTLTRCLEELKATGGEIWVKTGTYKPTTMPTWKVRAGKTQDVHWSFELYDNIKIYGGFAGTETIRNNRNFKTNPTYLSCELDSNTNCYQIIQGADNTIIDGFIIRDAGSNVPTRRRLKNSISPAEVFQNTAGTQGGGLYSNSTTTTVANSIFYKLNGGKGGAVYCIGQEDLSTNPTIKSPSFINVKFLGNTATQRGGAISADVQCNFDCKYCKFEHNYCGSKGGAVYLDFDCDINFYSTTEFENNYAGEAGGCIAADGKSEVTFEGVTTFKDNSAGWEGGCFYSGSGVGGNILQGFTFDDTTTFIGNALDHPDSGQDNIYGWPYTYVIRPGFVPTTSPPTQAPHPTTQGPTLLPTAAPTATPTEPTQSPTKSPTFTSVSPNILIFHIDDIGFTSDWVDVAPDGILLNGHEVSYLDLSESATPNINALLNDKAIMFSRAYCGGPKCSPSRFSLLTGRQPVRSVYGAQRTLQTSSGIYGVNVSIQTSKINAEDSTYTIQNTLKNHPITPYYTGQVGKWHLTTPDDNGHNLGCSSLNSVPDETLYDQCIEAAKDNGFDFVDAWYHGNILENLNFSHNPEWMVHKSIEFMNEALDNQQKPFFLYFASTLTHTPSISDALDPDKFTFNDSPKGTLTGAQRPIATGMKARTTIWSEAVAYGQNTAKTDKIAGLKWMDDSFGALINYLKTKGVYDNTLVILLSDHGMAAKSLLYEQGTRILQFIRYPLINNGTQIIIPSDFIVSNLDISAVIYDIVGIDVHRSIPEYVLDGKSWLFDVIDYIDDINNQPESEYERYSDMQNSHSIVSKDWKYIFRANLRVEWFNIYDPVVYYPQIYDFEQLYNLNSDPNEQTNLRYGIDNINQYGNIIKMFQTKMVAYVNDIACPLTSQCLIPDIIETSSPTTAPTDSPTFVGETYSPTPTPTAQPSHAPTLSPLAVGETPSPTQAPTRTGYTCTALYQRDYNYKSDTDPVGIDTSTATYEQKLAFIEASQTKFLSLAATKTCGDENDLPSLEFVYWFEWKQAKARLINHMVYCCAGSFGTNYLTDEDYKAVYGINYKEWDYSQAPYDDDSIDFSDDKIVVKEIIVFCMIGVIIIGLIIGSIVIYKKYKKKKQLQPTNDDNNVNMSHLKPNRMKKRDTVPSTSALPQIHRISQIFKNNDQHSETELTASDDDRSASHHSTSPLKISLHGNQGENHTVDMDIKQIANNSTKEDTPDEDF